MNFLEPVITPYKITMWVILITVLGIIDLSTFSWYGTLLLGIFLLIAMNFTFDVVDNYFQVSHPDIDTKFNITDALVITAILSFVVVRYKPHHTIT